MKKNNNTLGKVSGLLRSREASLMLVMILLVAVIQWRSGGLFLSNTVITQLTQNYAYTMVLSFGMLLVLLIGGIDISIGATLALSGMSTSLLMRDGIITNPLGAFLFSIMVGLICGMVIGTIVAKGKVIPIIATLGMQYIYRGLTYLVSDTQWVPSDKMLAGYKAFAQGSFMGLNNLFWIVIILFVVFLVFLKWTNLGRQIYEVGSNVEAAKISGIHIDPVCMLPLRATWPMARKWTLLQLVLLVVSALTVVRVAHSVFCWAPLPLQLSVSPCRWLVLMLSGSRH